jgi:hypothetical protein
MPLRRTTSVTRRSGASDRQPSPRNASSNGRWPIAAVRRELAPVAALSLLNDTFRHACRES